MANLPTGGASHWIQVIRNRGQKLVYSWF